MTPFRTKITDLPKRIIDVLDKHPELDIPKGPFVVGAGKESDDLVIVPIHDSEQKNFWKETAKNESEIYFVSFGQKK